MLTLGVSAEDDLVLAVGTFDVETEQGNTKILFVGGLLAGVELATLVDVFATVGAFHRERRHEANRNRLEAMSLGFLDPALDGARVKVRGKILRSDLSFGHDDQKWLRRKGGAGRKRNYDANLPCPFYSAWLG